MMPCRMVVEIVVVVVVVMYGLHGFSHSIKFFAIRWKHKNSIKAHRKRDGKLVLNV